MGNIWSIINKQLFVLYKPFSACPVGFFSPQRVLCQKLSSQVMWYLGRTFKRWVPVKNDKVVGLHLHDGSIRERLGGVSLCKWRPPSLVSWPYGTLLLLFLVFCHVAREQGGLQHLTIAFPLKPASHQIQGINTSPDKSPSICYATATQNKLIKVTNCSS